jgi:uncharacterized protein
MALTLYVDTSVLVSAFSNEPRQRVALALLQSQRWDQILISDWTLAEFRCAFHAKVLRGETPSASAQAIDDSIHHILTTGALTKREVSSEDFRSIEDSVPRIHCMVRGADALHLAVAARLKVTHFASLDLMQRTAASLWIPGIECVPDL